MATDMVDRVQWRRLRRSLREPQPWLTTVNTGQASTLSVCAYVPLARPVRAFLYPATRATPAQHHYAYQTIHTANYWERHTYLDVTISLLLQGTELRPREINYADDTVLLFPQLPFLLCLLFFDALSHYLHVFLFLFVSVDF